MTDDKIICEVLNGTETPEARKAIEIIKAEIEKVRPEIVNALVKTIFGAFDQFNATRVEGMMILSQALRTTEDAAGFSLQALTKEEALADIAAFHKADGTVAN